MAILMVADGDDRVSLLDDLPTKTWTVIGWGGTRSVWREGHEPMGENDLVWARRLADGTIVQVLPNGTTRPFETCTDWARFDAMTDEEVEANALSDPDNPPLTKEELARMRPIPDPRNSSRTDA